MATKERRTKWTPKFSAGQVVWEFDVNRRVYRKDENGKATGRLIFHEHFRPATITKVTAKGYQLGSGFEQDGREVENRYVTAERRAEMIWDNDRYRIAETVRRGNLHTVQAVAKLIGLEPEGL